MSGNPEAAAKMAAMLNEQFGAGFGRIIRAGEQT